MKAGRTTTGAFERRHEAHPVADGLDDRDSRHRLADARDQRPEAAPIFRRAYGRQRRAEHADAVPVEHAGVVERDRQVQAGLPAERREEGIRTMLLDHTGHELQRERAEDHRPANVGIGHHRRRVRVDEDRLDALASRSARQACTPA